MNNCIPMDVPKELKQATFARKNRFCLISDEFPEYSVQKVKVNYTKKLVKVYFHDIASANLGFDAAQWLQNLESNPENTTSRFCLETYSNVGAILYRVHFTGLQIVGHKMDFDYASSDTLSRKVVFTYSKHYFETEYGRTKEANHCRWTLAVRDSETSSVYRYNVAIVKRPSCNIVPLEISMLNCNVFVPDLVEWNACIVRPIDKFSSCLTGNKYEVTLTKEINGVNHEQWVFTDPFLFLNAEQNIEIKASQVRLQAFKKETISELKENERALPKSSD